MARQGAPVDRGQLLHCGPRPGGYGTPNREEGLVRPHPRTKSADHGPRSWTVLDRALQGGGLRQEAEEDGLLRSDPSRGLRLHFRNEVTIVLKLFI